MRHGDAPLISGQRQLSDTGIAEAGAMAQWLSSRQSFQAMLVSPLLRAQQTANEIESVTKSQYIRLDENLLKPESDPRIATSYFEALEYSSILLVSHMPLVVNLLEAWLPGQGRYFPTAAVAELEISERGVKLLSFTSPANIDSSL